MKPNYIVSGYPRSGTSMMMRALMAGGLEGAYSGVRNELAAHSSDETYQPNPDNELYELESWQYQQHGFPLMFAGKVVKCVTMQAHNLDVNYDGTKVVFMRRNSEEIRQSFLAVFRQRRAPTREQIEQEVDWCIRQMRDRRSFEVVELDYRSLIENARQSFDMLRALGWPIDSDKAAAEVKPELLRYRIENLEIGVA